MGEGDINQTETMAAFLELRGMAWLSPSGQVVSGNDDRELPILDGQDDISQVVGNSVGRVAGSRVVLETTRLKCEADRAEWHRYEMSMSNHDHIVSMARRLLHLDGWVLVQVMREHNRTPSLEVCGTEQAMRLSSPIFEKIGRIMGVQVSMSTPVDDGWNRDVPCLWAPCRDGRFSDDEAELSWLAAVQGLQKDRSGWLTPWGMVLHCPSHEHLEAVRLSGEAPGLCDGLALATSSLRVARDAWRREGMGDGHGFQEVNRLDTMEQHERSSLVEALYDRGWVRLGLFDDTSGRTNLDAEGRSYHLRQMGWLLDMLGGYVDAMPRARVAGEASDTEPSMTMLPAANLHWT